MFRGIRGNGGGKIRPKETTMKRFFLMALIAAAGFTAMGSRDAHAQSLGGFYDSCAPDFLYFAPGCVAKDVRVGYSAVHIGRPHCPWLIIDVYGAYGQDMYFNGQWAYSQPSSSYQCNGAKYSYVVARKADDLLYWIVGQGTAVGTWTNWFGHQFCLWTLQSDG